MWQADEEMKQIPVRVTQPIKEVHENTLALILSFMGTNALKMRSQLVEFQNSHKKEKVLSEDSLLKAFGLFRAPFSGVCTSNYFKLLRKNLIAMIDALRAEESANKRTLSNVLNSIYLYQMTLDCATAI